MAPSAPLPHSPAWSGPLPPESPRLSLCSARLSGDLCLGSVPCAGSPAVRSCSGAHLWLRCAHAALLAVATGAGPKRDRAGGDGVGEAPVGTAAPSPPNRCLPPSRKLDSGRGPGAVPGITQRRMRSPLPWGSSPRPCLASQVASLHIYTQCPAFTHT